MPSLNVFAKEFHSLAARVSLDKRQDTFQLVRSGKEIDERTGLKCRLVLAHCEKKEIRLDPFFFFERVEGNHEPGFEVENVPVRRENRNKLIIHTGGQ